MKRQFWRKICLMVFMIAGVGLGALPAQASMVLETTGFLNGVDHTVHAFSVAQDDHTVTVTLNDLSFDQLVLEDLRLSISTAVETVETLIGTGQLTFPAIAGTTYFANIFGVGGGDYQTGLYGLQVTATPLPPSLLLLAPGLLILLRNRRTG